MEELHHAAMRGDIQSLHEIIAKDIYILDEVLAGCFKGKNPLHLATLTRQAEFVEELLKIKPKLAKVVDMELGAALHIASANGDSEIVKALLERSPEMCMARDRDGHNPLHIAAMNGKVDVLEKLVQTCPLAAQVVLDRGDTILHLCVNYNQLDSLRLLLEMIIDPDFIHSKDANGNTILHIAATCKRFEIVEYVLLKTEINLNATNGAGWTARDLHLFVRDRGPKEEVDDDQIENLFREIGAKRRSRHILVAVSTSLKKFLEPIMVVATLFATLAFQVAVNPPGGVWQEDGVDHQAGESILASKYPAEYRSFMYVNTLGFVVSLVAILVRLTLVVLSAKTLSGWILSAVMSVTILTTAYAYTHSVMVLSPKDLNGDVINSFKAVMAAFVILVVPTLFVSALERRRTGFILFGSALGHWRTKKKRERERMSGSNPSNAEGENPSGGV